MKALHHSLMSLPVVLTSTALVTLAQSPSPGLRVYAPVASTDTLLVDTNGQTVHTWTASGNAGVAAYVEPDGTLLRTLNIPGGPAVAGRGGGLQRIAFDGSVTWDYRYADANGWSHIDLEPLPNGNVLLLVWDRMTAAEAIAAGRDPALLNSPDWLPDGIVEVRQNGLTTGEIVWEWHMMDHVIQDFDPLLPNYGIVGNHPELLDINFPAQPLGDGEWNHCNAIDYDPVNDLILLNSPFQNEFWIIDHSTTTAEAAGHSGGNYGRGGDFLYRWGNPQAYRAGTASDQKLFFMHSTKFVQDGRRGAGNVLVFNNRAGTPMSMTYSSVVEIDIPSNFTPPPPSIPWGPAGFVWEYTEPNPTDLYSALMSSVERMPNGNTLISSAQQGGYTFELDPTGTTKLWEFTPLQPGQLVFQCNYLEGTRLWADANEVSLNAGGAVSLDVVAGSAHANDIYLMLGSSSGTSPGTPIGALTLPLNVDGYTSATIAAANRIPFGNSIGTLDLQGRATATWTLPGGKLPLSAVGLELHHAFVIFDAATVTVEQVTNAQSLLWTP